MTSVLKNLFFWVGLPLAIAIFLLVLLCNREDDSLPARQKEIGDEVQVFLEEKARTLPEEEDLRLVSIDGPIHGWALLTLARVNPDLNDSTGTEGLLVIARQTTAGYQFYLQGDTDFDLHLPRLPRELLNTKVRPYFLSGDEHESVVSSFPFFRREESNRYSDLSFKLPFSAGEICRVSTPPGQGHHQGAIEHAVDCDAPDGQQLVAVTTAKVIEIKDNSSVGACDPSFAGDANYIRLQINALTTVLYLHTKVGSIARADLGVGDTVIQGQPVAEVGDTGFTCNWSGNGPGAHLHIVLEQWCESGNQKYICGSIPMDFEEIDGAPRYGAFYISTNEFIPVVENQKPPAEVQKEAMRGAITAFHEIYACSTLVSCDQGGLLSFTITDGLWHELFPESPSICIFGCGVKWDFNRIESFAFVDFEPTASNQHTVRSEQTWKSKTSSGRTARHGVIIHHLLVDNFLVRDGGIWKVDGYKIICGYTLNQEGKLISQQEVLEEYNLYTCPIQPPSGSAKS